MKEAVVTFHKIRVIKQRMSMRNSSPIALLHITSFILRLHSNFLLLSVVLACALMSVMVRADEDSTKTIYLYTYHNKPPFVVDEELGVGLYYDLAQYLSDKDPLHTYQTNYIPR